MEKKKQSDQTSPDTDSIIGQLTEQHRRAQTQADPANQNIGVYFGLAEKGKRIDALALKLRNGRTFFLHYAFRFNLDMPSEGEIILMATSARITVTITGRGLSMLTDALMGSQVVWIRESASPSFDDGDGIFVSNIKIEGQAFEE